jgi:hypothetical protein
VRLLFWHGDKASGKVDGALLKHVAAGSICDRRDAADVEQTAAGGSGPRSFDDLGFAAGSAFTMREEGRDLRLALSASEGRFSIEATLASR